MSTLKKTASIAVAVMTMVWAVGITPASAATVDELQAQITALLRPYSNSSTRKDTQLPLAELDQLATNLRISVP